MFTPKKTIPKLAVAMLALTGCGDDGNGTGGSVGPGGTGGNGTRGGTSSALLEPFCMKLAECYSDTVPDYSAQDCQDYYNNFIFPEYNVDPSCEALTSYFECGLQLSCEEILADSNSCDDEFNQINAECVTSP